MTDGGTLNFVYLTYFVHLHIRESQGLINESKIMNAFCVVVPLCLPVVYFIISTTTTTSTYAITNKFRMNCSLLTTLLRFAMSDSFQDHFQFHPLISHSREESQS